MSSTEAPQIKYSWLSANCGLKVSRMALGTSSFGNTSMKDPNFTPVVVSEEESIALLNRYAELGGNFIDTSNIYTAGESETILGKWLQSRASERERFVIGTKVRFGTKDYNMSGHNTLYPNKTGLCRKSIISNVEDSLKRLQTDYIDLYQVHLPDSGVPVEETLRTMDDLIRRGKILYFGGSNMRGYELKEYLEVAKSMGLASKMVTLQQQYNLLARTSEWEVFEVCRSEGVGVLPWSPLKGGLLTAKHKREGEVDPNTRVGWATKNNFNTQATPVWTNFKDDEQYWKIIDALQDIAKTRGKSASQVALRWVSQRPFVTSVIGGARNLQQLESNMQALDDTWCLTDEEMKALDEASALPLPYPYDMKQSVNRERTRLLGQFAV